MYSKFIEEFVGHIYVVNWWRRGSSRALLFDEKEELKELVYIPCFPFTDCTSSKRRRLLHI